MAKRASAAAGKKTKRESDQCEARKPMDLASIRESISRSVGNEATGMVGQTIEEAKKGHYAALKYLFEISGLYPTNGEPEATGEEESLARILLRRLGLPQAQEEGEGQGAEPQAASIAESGDALE